MSIEYYHSIRRADCKGYYARLINLSNWNKYDNYNVNMIFKNTIYNNFI